MNSDINTGMGSASATTPGMEEQHQPLGGMPGSETAGVRGMAAKAGEKIMDTAERQKAVGADYVDGIAEAVRRSAGEFDAQMPQAADYIRYAADQIETLSDSVRRRDISQMMADVQSFARRQPTAFLGLGVLAGFAAVRFLRSGSAGATTGEDWQQRREPMDDGRFGGTTTSSTGGQGMTPGAGL